MPALRAQQRRRIAQQVRAPPPAQPHAPEAKQAGLAGCDGDGASSSREVQAPASPRAAWLARPGVMGGFQIAEWTNRRVGW